MSEVTIRTKYGELTGELQVTEYADGSTALVLHNPEWGQRGEVLSTNLTGYGRLLPSGHVHVKEYGEHEGLADGLVDAGVAEKVGSVEFGPFNSKAQLLKLTLPE